MGELKPCPFCGAKPGLIDFDDSPDFALCENGHNSVCLDPDDWNRRHNERTHAEEAVLKAAVAVSRASSDGMLGYLGPPEDIEKTDALDAAVDALLRENPAWGEEGKGG